MTNVSSEIAYRDGASAPQRETRRVRAVFNKNNDNMSISCRGNETRIGYLLRSVSPITVPHQSSPRPPPPSRARARVIKTKPYGVPVARAVPRERSRADGLSRRDFCGCKFQHDRSEPVAHSRVKTLLLQRRSLQCFPLACRVVHHYRSDKATAGNITSRCSVPPNLIRCERVERSFVGLRADFSTAQLAFLVSRLWLGPTLTRVKV